MKNFNNNLIKIKKCQKLLVVIIEFPKQKKILLDFSTIHLNLLNTNLIQLTA